MSQYAYTLIGLTALVAGLVGLLVFVLLRFGAAVRDMRGQLRGSGQDRLFMASALEEALAKLRAQERAMAQRAEASERLSDEIVRGMTAGLLVVGADGGVRILNPAGHRLLLVPAGSALGGYRDLLVHAPQLTSVVDECLATGRPIVRKSIEMTQASSTATHLGVTVSPMLDESGRTHGAICLFTDLTDIVDLEEQLRLKDSLARLGELTAGLAHEFRTGLSTIHGYGRLIDPDQIPESQRPYVLGIRKETDALGAVVTNFLNFARPTQLSVAPVDLGALVDRAVEEARADRLAEGGTIVREGQFPVVDGDEVLLRQAVGNLIRNALEACARARVAPKVTIEGRIDHGQGMVRLVVTDNGPGIDPAVRDRIFRPFVTTKAGGTGLGLALVQKIVVTHNGRASASSTPGHGAAFQVTLPIPGGR